MKQFQIKSGNLLFTIAYGDASEGPCTMSAAGRVTTIPREFAMGLEALGLESRRDLLDTVFKCRKELAALASRIDERESTTLDANSLVGAMLFAKVIH